MFINATGHYVPSLRVDNDYFLDKNGVSSEWIFSRTGIKTRSKAAPEENAHTMAKEAVINAMKNLPYDIKEVDLIVAASYTPYDMALPLPHFIQHEFEIENAKAVFVSAACSSSLNGIEVVETYFKSNKATKALFITAEHNSIYIDESDPKCGHLFGDAAAALFLSKDRISENDFEILSVYTAGLGHIGDSMNAVSLRLNEGKLKMPGGKDLFRFAGPCMINSLERVMTDAHITLADLDYVIPHQANMRIVANMLTKLDFPAENVLSNIEEYGNTGSSSAILVLSENMHKFKKGDIVGVSVFGGGYSTGAFLFRA